VAALFSSAHWSSASIGELGRAFGVLDVLLDELATVGAQRRVDELDRSHAVEIHRELGLAHGIERLDDVLLAADHVERRQLPQPRRGALRALQRVGRVGLRGKKSEHCFHGPGLPTLGRRFARLGGATHGRVDTAHGCADAAWPNRSL
jgi:hypothetical protein